MGIYISRSATAVGSRYIKNDAPSCAAVKHYCLVALQQMATHNRTMHIANPSTYVCHLPPKSALCMAVICPISPKLAVCVILPPTSEAWIHNKWLYEREISFFFETIFILKKTYRTFSGVGDGGSTWRECLTCPCYLCFTQLAQLKNEYHGHICWFCIKWW